MTPSRSPDALSGLAPLLRVRPELESLCLFGAQWALPHEISTGGWATEGSNPAPSSAESNANLTSSIRCEDETRHRPPTLLA